MALYDIVLKPCAVRDLDGLRKYDATIIADAMETHLGDAPTKVSRSRIKRLRGIRDPDYRLRVGEFRVFYTVDEEAGRVRASITTAAEPAAEDLDSIIATFRKTAGRDVVAEVKTDEELLGGVVVELEGRVYDGSIRTRLARLAARMSGE